MPCSQPTTPAAFSILCFISSSASTGISFAVWHFYIRKSGHVVGYGTLSILLFRAWRATLPAPNHLRWTMRWANIAILGTALVASLDEWHQSFIPSRTGRWQDVVLDTCAGIAAQVLLLLWIRSFGKSAVSSS